jgi:hypothetical protein
VNYLVELFALDQPLNFDAWNADIFHLDTKEIIDAINVKVVEPKGLRASIIVECVYKQSKISASTRSMEPHLMTMALVLMIFSHAFFHNFDRPLFHSMLYRVLSRKTPYP